MGGTGFWERLRAGSRRLRTPALAFLALLTLQAFYYAGVYATAPAAPVPAGLVLVYSGGENRETAVRGWKAPGPPPRFLFSGKEYTRPLLRRLTGLPDARILVEDRARTTDQNIRYSLPLIRASGARHLVLALPWYHLPRALFLTRLYLLGSGIGVTPCATMPVPPGWWHHRDFWLEYLKFWGSLLRVFLALFGMEDWPPHFMASH